MPVEALALCLCVSVVKNTEAQRHRAHGKALMEKLSNRRTDITSSRRNVLETAAEGIVVTLSRVIDTKGGIDRCRNVFRVNRPLLGPSGILHEGPVRSRRSQDTSTLDTATSNKSRVHEVVVAATLTGDVSYGSAEFAFDHDQRFVELRSSIAA